LNFFVKLNWAVAVESNSKPRNQPSKLFDLRGRPHPFPLTREYLLKEYQDVVTGVGCYPGPPYNIETNPDVSRYNIPQGKSQSSYKAPTKKSWNDLRKQAFWYKYAMNTHHGLTPLWLQERPMAQFAFAWTPVTLREPSSAPLTM